jgi:hypothetical protein
MDTAEIEVFLVLADPDFAVDRPAGTGPGWP